jgi:amino acid transporter
MATTTQTGGPGEVFIRRSSGLTRQISAWDALAYCCLGPGYIWPFIYISWIPWLYMGAHVPLATLAVLAFMPIAGLYWLFSVSMSRSGGEYVYLSRVIHPAVGLVCSFIISFTAILWCGQLTDWMIKYGLADLLRGVGWVYNDAGWLAAGDVIGGEWARTLIGIVSILGTTLVMLKGSRWMMNLSWAAMIGAAIALVAFAIAVFTSSGNFAANWTAMTGLNYDQVIPLAQNEATYTLGFSAMATIMAGFTYVGLNTLGSTFSANLAGEIRGVQKSQLIALLGSLVVMMIVWFCFYQLIYVGFGQEWMGALVALFNTGNAAYPFGANEPFSTLLVGIMTQNPVYVVIISLCFMLTAFGTATAVAFAPTRNMFAWAFDRMIPPKMAEIDRRFKSPWLVVTLTAIAAFIFLLIDVWQNSWFAMASNSIITWFVAWALLGIAGMVFPYVRRELFLASPPLVRTKVLGIPLISVLGFLTLAVSIAEEWFMLVPMFEGKLPAAVFYTLAAFVIIPLVIYFVSSSYYRSRGVSLGMQFSELPPE